MQSFCAFLGVLVLVCSSLVVSQTLDQEVALLPNCSTTCINSFATSVGCGLTDYTCQCSNQQGIVGGLAVGNTASSCIIDACGIKNATTTWSTFANVCNIVQGTPLSSSSVSDSTAVTSVKQSTALPISSSSRFVTTTQSLRSTFTSPTPGLSTTASTSVLLLSLSSTSEPTSTYALQGIASVAEDNSSSLSYGARAGIAIAISIFSLLLVCCVMYVLRQRQRQARPSGLRTFGKTNPSTSILPVQTSQVQGDIGNIKILRHVSIISFRLDNPENRPTVPTKDGESEKESYVKVVIKEREFRADAETSGDLNDLPSIRASLESVRVHGDFEVGTKVDLRPTPTTNEGRFGSQTQPPHIRDLEPQTPFAPRILHLDPFADNTYTLPPPPSSPSSSSIRTSQLPQTPSSFETTEQGDGSSRGSNRSTLSLFPQPPRSSLSAPRVGRRKSGGSALNDSVSRTGIRSQQFSTPSFQSDAYSNASQTHVSNADQENTESKEEDEVPPLPPMISPLGQNPFEPGDANFEAAQKYFRRENSIKR